ncbi:hypothetical protein QK290_18070, partial [Pseudarthrobacter sp. AL07]|uniref:hypothetical protein n=1 Tax=unclassified Pseudarthrobacter TaxID=2647000 RepID=UPI002499AEC4
MREPRLVPAVGFTVAPDLPVDALIAFPDPGGDRFHRLAGGETIGDFDPVILGQVPAADRLIWLFRMQGVAGVGARDFRGR